MDEQKIDNSDGPVYENEQKMSQSMLEFLNRMAGVGRISKKRKAQISKPFGSTGMGGATRKMLRYQKRVESGKH